MSDPILPDLSQALTGVNLTLTTWIVLGFGYLNFKHLMADFFLQSQKMIEEKGYYGKFWGIVHSALHALLSFPLYVFYAITLSPSKGMVLAILTIVFEFVIHYHMDWIKMREGRIHPCSVAESRFWRWIGVDQFVHHMTYLFMQLAWVGFMVKDKNVLVINLFQ